MKLYNYLLYNSLDTTSDELNTLYKILQRTPYRNILSAIYSNIYIIWYR